jgi:hypothetical protein
MQIQKINNEQDALGLININNQKLKNLSEDDREKFKDNFISICSDKYLTGKANPQELLNVAYRATRAGLDISPSAKELYILPFSGKGGVKLEIVMRAEAIQKIIAEKGFFVECINIWDIDSSEVLESDLTIGQQARLEKTKPEFVEKSFLGFYFKITSLDNIDMPRQTCIVGLGYLKEVTKQLQSKTHQIANYKHKAFRKMFSEVNLANGKKSNLEKQLGVADRLNYDVIEVETTKKATNSNGSNSLSFADKKEVIDQVETVTVNDITNLYKQATPDAKAKMADIMQLNPDWRGYAPQVLSDMKADLEKCL